MGWRVKISEAFELYRLERIVYLNQSKRTEEMSLCAMNSFIRFAGDINMSELSFDMVRKWKEHLEKELSQNTARGYILKLRVVLKHLSIKGYQVLNYEMVGVPKKQNKVIDFLTPHEIDRFIECSFAPVAGYTTENRYRNRAVIAFLFASGIRVSELTAMDRDMLRSDRTFTVTGKGDKVRLCFFDARSEQYIYDYLRLRSDSNPALFISTKSGRRMNRGAIEEMFRNVSKKAAFNKPITPHTIRHSYATDLLRNNTNLIYLKKFMGHSSVQTTEMYTHVVDEDLRQIYLDKHSTK